LCVFISIVRSILARGTQLRRRLQFLTVGQRGFFDFLGSGARIFSAVSHFPDSPIFDSAPPATELRRLAAVGAVKGFGELSSFVPLPMFPFGVTAVCICRLSRISLVPKKSPPLPHPLCAGGSSMAQGGLRPPSIGGSSRRRPLLI